MPIASLDYGYELHCPFHLDWDSPYDQLYTEFFEAVVSITCIQSSHGRKGCHDDIHNLLMIPRLFIQDFKERWFLIIVYYWVLEQLSILYGCCMIQETHLAADFTMQRSGGHMIIHHGPEGHSTTGAKGGVAIILCPEWYYYWQKRGSNIKKYPPPTQPDS